MKKLLFKLALGVAVLLVLAYLARNLFVRVGVEAAVERLTGFPLVIGSVNLTPFANQLDVRDLRLLNPEPSPERLFLDLPRLYVEYDPVSFFSRTSHLRELRLDVRQLIVVKTAKGVSNLSRLRGAVAPAPAPASPPARTNLPPPAPTPAGPHYRVDVLHVRIGQVIIKDFTGPRPTEKTHNLNFSATYRDLTESGAINRVVLFAALGQLGLADLGFAADGLLRGLGGVTDAAGHLLKDTGQAIKQGGQTVWDKVKPK